MVRPLVAVALVMTLAACDRNAGNICSHVPTLASDIAGYDGSTEEDRWVARMNIAEHCVQRWAYRLAPSRDAADAVARAVVANCAEGIRMSVRASVQHFYEPGDRARVLDQSIAEALKEQQGQALFYLSQARASSTGCPAP